MKSTLITGGARSGKSRFAQELVLKSGKAVLFVATAQAGDEEMRQRIEAHKGSRPAGWRTLEATTGIGQRIVREIGDAGIVVIDCITLLVSNILAQLGDPAGERIDAGLAEREVIREIEALTECISHTDASFIIVTNEVGLGIVPADSLSRLYRDLLGKTNQRLAEKVDEVYLLVAGLTLRIKPQA